MIFYNMLSIGPIRLKIDLVRSQKRRVQKIFIARPSYEGLKITVHSTIELVQFLLKAGVPYMF